MWNPLNWGGANPQGIEQSFSPPGFQIPPGIQPNPIGQGGVSPFGWRNPGNRIPMPVAFNAQPGVDQTSNQFPNLPIPDNTGAGSNVFGYGSPGAGTSGGLMTGDPMADPRAAILAGGIPQTNAPGADPNLGGGAMPFDFGTNGVQQPLPPTGYPNPMWMYHSQSGAQGG